MKGALARFLMTWLMALGLCAPLLYALGLQAHLGAAAVWITAIPMAVCLASVNRWTRWGVPAALGALALIWLASGGWLTVEEVGRGVALRISGLACALPMVGNQAAMLLAAALSALCCLLTMRGVSPAPAVAVCVLALAMMWLSDVRAMYLAAPALAAVLTLTACAGREGTQPLRVLPWMSALALAACLVIPEGGVTIATMKEAADTLRQRIYDYLFFTQPRNVFTLATEGYYPQGMGQLGGAANPTGHPVMEVHTPRKTYLRGVMKDRYTGRVWLDTIGDRRYLWASPTTRNTRDRLLDANLPPESLSAITLLQPSQVTVRMLDKGASTLFLPQRVRSLSVSGDMVPYFNDASEVFITRDLEAEDTYTVLAPLMVAGDPGLDVIVDACARSANDAQYQRILQIYTPLPDHLQSQVFELCRTALQGAQTPYAQALNIQNWLRSNYRYTLDVEQQPENMDFVSNFLLSTKEGYCTYFASAMTVLCRMAGLPARYVEGYLAEPDENGVARVTGRQAHAWTEVYFAGFGWLTFDATPPTHDNQPPEGDEDGGGSEDDNENENDEPEDEPTPPPPEEEDEPDSVTDPTVAPGEYVAPATDEEAEEPPESGGAPGASQWFAWLLLVLLLAALGFRLWWTSPSACAKRARGDDERWQVWTQAVHDALRAQGITRRAGESPLMYLSRAVRGGEMAAAMTELGGTETCVAYGRYTPSLEDAEAARALFEAQRRAMRLLPRLRLTLLRAFTPVKRRAWTN